MRQARGEPIRIVAAMACLVLAVNLQCTVEAGNEDGQTFFQSAKTVRRSSSSSVQRNEPPSSYSGPNGGLVRSGFTEENTLTHDFELADWEGLVTESPENCQLLISSVLNLVKIPVDVVKYTMSMIDSLGEEQLFNVDVLTTLITEIKRPAECDNFLKAAEPFLENYECTEGLNYKKFAETFKGFKLHLLAARACQPQVQEPQPKPKPQPKPRIVPPPGFVFRANPRARPQPKVRVVKAEPTSFYHP